MIGSYLEKHELEKLDELLKQDDTIDCWIATRINGSSASISCDGNVSKQLLKMLDERLLKLIKKQRK